LADKEQSPLLERLKRQLSAKGVKGAAGMAVALLKRRGQMSSSGKLTSKGKRRQSLGAAGRAKDRASKRSGKSTSSYKYNQKTNRATLK